MDSNKLTDLKAHSQFLLGRLDSLQWALNELSLDDEQKAKLKAYYSRVDASQKEYQGKIDKINAEAAEKREETKRKKLEAEQRRKRAYA